MDWPGLMRAGMHGLGLTPEVFWRLTPVELALMLGRAGGGQAPFSRARLEELARQWPDGPVGRGGPREAGSGEKGGQDGGA